MGLVTVGNACGMQVRLTNPTAPPHIHRSCFVRIEILCNVIAMRSAVRRAPSLPMRGPNNLLNFEKSVTGRTEKVGTGRFGVVGRTEVVPLVRVVFSFAFCSRAIVGENEKERKEDVVNYWVRFSFCSVLFGEMCAQEEKIYRMYVATFVPSSKRRLLIAACENLPSSSDTPCPEQISAPHRHMARLVHLHEHGLCLSPRLSAAPQ